VTTVCLLVAAGQARADRLWLRQGYQGYTGATDTWLDEDEKTTNYGNDVRLNIYSVNDAPDENALIRFSLAGLLPGSPIQVNWARLSLRLNDTRSLPSGDWCTIGAYRISPYRDWVESQATWNVFRGTSYWSVPGCEGASDRQTNPDSTVRFDANSVIGVHYTWDVTASVTEYLENGVTNCGWLLRVTASSSGGMEGVYLDSTEATMDGYRPYLEIDYTVVPEPAAAATLALGLLAMLRRRH